MKILTLWAEKTVKPAFVLLAMISILMIWASDVLANSDYSGCVGCHGDFRDNPYLGPPGGTGWPTGSLHNIHRNNMLSTDVNDDCDVCHRSGTTDAPVLLGSSAGGDGLSAISCVGCHGRDEDMGNDSGGVADSPGRGMGLRRHHPAFAGCGNCHNDVSSMASPVGENILPNYYASPGTGHPNIPSNSCSPSGEENFAGSATGLDNDGNGVYDTADASCVIPVELMIFEID